MEVDLTQGTVMRILNGEVTSDIDLKPVLQVAELKEVRTVSKSQEKEPKKPVRYRLMLSDGSFTLQGMLASAKNELVTSSSLTVGSVVTLTQYICNLIQDRMIVIIMDLEVIIPKHNVIGKPVPAPRSSRPQQVSTNQPGALPESGGYGVGNAPQSNPQVKPEGSAGVSASVPSSGPYGAQNTGISNSRPAVSQSPSTFNRHSPPSYQQPSQMYPNRSPVARSEAPEKLVPISALNPYLGRWTIKARVTSKADLRHYSNARGEGKVFSFDLLDSDGGEIRATCFNAAADLFYSQIEAGRVYMISKGILKPAQKSFNHLRNDYEVVLDVGATVQPCFEDDSFIPKQQFHFCNIVDIEGLESNSIVDVIGIVTSISPSSSIMRKNGAETHKRTLQLKDMSDRSVELTLWGDFCHGDGQRLQTSSESGEFPVLAVKSARVNDFNGKVLGTISSTQLLIEPDFLEAHKLREWFCKEGKSMPVVSLSRETPIVGRKDIRKTISQIKDERLGTSEKPDWITVVATIAYIKLDTFCYTACPIMIGERPCNKKVTNNGDGKWRCDKCDRSVDECDYRYLIQFQIQDHTGSTWVNAFQESGQELIGLPAKEMYHLKYESENEERFSEIMHRVRFNKYVFKLKVKEEKYNEEQRVKSTVVNVEKGFSESKFLLDSISKIISGDLSSFAPKIETDPHVSESMTQVKKQPASTVASGGYVSSTNHSTQFENQYNTGHISTNYPSVMNTTQSGNADSVSPGGRVSGVSGECYKCHQPGHWSRDCPGVNAKASYAGGGNSVECYKCHQPGHYSRDCPGVGVNATATASGGGSGECFKCHQTGHWARDCPSANAKTSYSGGSGGSNSRECFRCHQHGHWARDCPGAAGNAAASSGGRYSGY